MISHLHAAYMEKRDKRWKRSCWVGSVFSQHSCLTQRSPEWRQENLRVADGRVIGEVTRPDQGRLAFFGELEYEVDGVSYTLSTQMRMTQ